MDGMGSDPDLPPCYECLQTADRINECCRVKMSLRLVKKKYAFVESSTLGVKGDAKLQKDRLAL
jgi:hypothetical protein